MTWMQTYTGLQFDLTNPEPSAVRLADIAAGLSRIARFNGHTHDHYSVAQHSLLCESLVTGGDLVFRLAVLLHDAHEAYTGDITTPVQDALSEVLDGARWGVGHLQRGLDAAIYEAFGWPHGAGTTNAQQIKIRRLDLLALAIEKRDMLAPEPAPWIPLPDPAGHERIVAMDHRAAGELFKARAMFLVYASYMPAMPTLWEGGPDPRQAFYAEHRRQVGDVHRMDNVR